MALMDYVPGAGYGAKMRKQIGEATDKGGIAAGVGQTLRMLPGAPLAAADDVMGKVVKPIIDPYAQALKTAGTGDATPIGQEQEGAAQAAEMPPAATAPAPASAHNIGVRAPAPMVSTPTATEKAAAPLPQFGDEGTGYIRNNSTGATQLLGAANKHEAPQLGVQRTAGGAEAPALIAPIGVNKLASTEKSTYTPETLAGALVQNNEAKRQDVLKQKDNENALASFDAAGKQANEQARLGVERQKVAQDKVGNEARNAYYKAQTRGLELGQVRAEKLSKLEDALRRSDLTPEQRANATTEYNKLKNEHLNEQKELINAKAMAQMNAFQQAGAQ